SFRSIVVILQARNNSKGENLAPGLRDFDRLWRLFHIVLSGDTRLPAAARHSEKRDLMLLLFQALLLLQHIPAGLSEFWPFDKLFAQPYYLCCLFARAAGRE